VLLQARQRAVANGGELRLVISSTAVLPVFAITSSGRSVSAARTTDRSDHSNIFSERDVVLAPAARARTTCAGNKGREERQPAGRVVRGSMEPRDVVVVPACATSIIVGQKPCHSTYRGPQ
jgi:hypothetical protein